MGLNHGKTAFISALLKDQPTENFQSDIFFVMFYFQFSIFMFPYFPFPILFRPILLLISTIILLSFFLALSPLLERLVFRVENWDSVPELPPEVHHARAGLHGAKHGLAVFKVSANGVPVPQV